MFWDLSILQFVRQGIKFYLYNPRQEGGTKFVASKLKGISTINHQWKTRLYRTHRWFFLCSDHRCRKKYLQKELRQSRHRASYQCMQFLVTEETASQCSKTKPPCQAQRPSQPSPLGLKLQDSTTQTRSETSNVSCSSEPHCRIAP